MLQTIIKKGSYYDSVSLMLLSGKISSVEGVQKVSIMMATNANKSIFEQGGLATEELMAAGPNDMAIVADVSSPEIIDVVEKQVEDHLNCQNDVNKSENSAVAKSWEQALNYMPEPDLAVISIPGTYAASEAERALDLGLNVFMFSDNVPIEDEKRLKLKAHQKGLVVMGPDCGTGIINGVPIAFTNDIKKGSIGIVGASGTGIQEVSTIIDRLGEGVTNALGTGGRDLSVEIGGITMLDCIDALEKDPNTKVLVVLSKPPAKEVRDRVVSRLSKCTKPVVSLFLGEKPTFHEQGFYHAYTLDETARIAVSLVRSEDVTPFKYSLSKENVFDIKDGKTIKAYYSGGTLASEAAMLLKDALNIADCSKKQHGFMFNQGGHIIVDLGDDVYTQGKPHPMIDPAKRIECMESAVDDASTGVVLFDVVLGYGSSDDMASSLVPTIMQLTQKATQQQRTVCFVATVCGTFSDPQNYHQQVLKLKQAGVIVCDTNMLAVETALNILGYSLNKEQKEIVSKKQPEKFDFIVGEKVYGMLNQKPKCINIGLRNFSTVIDKFNCPVVQFDWSPPANGDIEMIKMLSFLREYKF